MALLPQFDEALWAGALREGEAHARLLHLHVAQHLGLAGQPHRLLQRLRPSLLDQHALLRPAARGEGLHAPPASPVAPAPPRASPLPPPTASPFAPSTPTSPACSAASPPPSARRAATSAPWTSCAPIAPPSCATSPSPSETTSTGAAFGTR